MSTVLSVRTDPPYAVTVGRGLLAHCGDWLKAAHAPCRIALVADANAAAAHLPAVENSLTQAGFSVCVHRIPAGEDSKTLSTLGDLLNAFASDGLTRSDAVAALGGGMCGDLAGFAAAVYLRGVPCFLLPTTLLSAVDASVGGKTAIDLPAGKNLAGTFTQPAAVLCDPDSLRTLPDSVYADGMAEAIKTGVLAGNLLFSLLETGKLSTEDVITRCIAYKAAVVEQDPREKGLRKCLNLGHTAGHAMEVCSGYRISHGQAVARGLALISRSAERLGWAEAGLADRVCRCLRRWNLPTTPLHSPEQLAQAALADKKRAGNTITLVVPRSIGRCTLETLPVADLASVLAAGWEV